jgi:hypothetical protein
MSAYAIREYHDIGSLPLIGPLLRGAGDLLVPDDPEIAAILHGAGDTNFPSPHREDLHREAIAAIDATLGMTRRIHLNDHGKAMNLDDAVALALNAIGRVAGTFDDFDLVDLTN